MAYRICNNVIIIYNNYDDKAVDNIMWHDIISIIIRTILLLNKLYSYHYYNWQRIEKYPVYICNVQYANEEASHVLIV